MIIRVDQILAVLLILKKYILIVFFHKELGMARSDGPALLMTKIIETVINLV